MTQDTTNKKFFTTSEYRKQGVSKKTLKSNSNYVNLGTFPQVKNNKRVFESIWTYNPELASLIKQSKKLIKRQTPIAEVKPVIDQIESIIRDTLGFNVPEETEETNDRKEDTQESNDEEVNSQKDH